MKKYLLLMLCLVILFNGCDKNEEEPQAPDISVFDLSQETQWDYWVVGRNGDNFFVNVLNNKPTSVYYTPNPDEEGYSVFFDQNGYPNKLIINDYIFLFANFSGTKVDAALISPDGTINIARDVETDINWNEDFLKSASAEPSDWLRWTGHALGAAACTAGILAGPATFGLSWVVTGIGCGATAVSILTEFLPEDYEVLGLTASTIGPIATAVGCVNDLGVSCALGTASTAFSLMSINEEKIEESYDDVQVADAALEYGYGDVQVTLTWDNTADLDLHVFDPNGDEIYWNDKYSSSNGVLDVDDIDGKGPENIYWPPYEAPGGNYQVYVHMYPWNDSDYQYVTGNSYYPSSSNYSVLVTAFGETKKFTGSISFDETVHITDFDQNGLKSAQIQDHKITITHKK
ncbi:hypothetical protein [uncultured Draconibacterium sp.]|uniref:YfaP family protein n=1 Tax=uncultured Draconibacterium sp. TaxID=1573823 RepID=UPI0029C7A0C8|nr:hypothetical protein [uncultured Draconibacterium sp.]